MTELSAILHNISTVGFIFVSLAAIVDWLRHRSQSRGYLALALGLFGAVTLLGAVAALVGRPAWLADLNLVLFMACGFAFLMFRHSLIPLPRWGLALSALLCALTAGLGVTAGFPTTSGARLTTYQLFVVYGMILLWCVCIGEPAVRLWIMSRGRPAVQRSRLRALSVGNLVIVAILLFAVGASGPRGTQLSPLATLGTQLVGLAVIPILYVSFAPPRWLRRAWRAQEESQLGRAMQDLLAYSPNRQDLAEGALSWAVRLIGADAGGILDIDGNVLAAQRIETGRLRVLARSTSVRSGAVLAIPIPLKDGFGTMVVVQGAFTPPFGTEEEGRLTQYAVAVAAALDRVKLSESQRAAEERFRRAFDEAPIGMAITGLDGRFVNVNQKLAEMLGRRVSDLEGRPVRSLTHPDDVGADEEAMRSMRAGETSSFKTEKRYLRRDGSSIWVELHVTIVRDTSGRPLHFLSQIIDVDAAKLDQRLKGLQLEVTRMVAESRSTGELFPALLDALTGFVQGERGEIWLLDRGAQMLRLETTAGLDGGEQVPPSRAAKLRRGSGLAGMTWERGLATFVPDLRTNLQESGIKGGSRAALGVPLLDSSEFAGVVAVFGTNGFRPDDDVLHALSGIGSQVGQFIARVRAEAASHEAAVRLAEMAATDPLTGLPNRRAFDSALEVAQLTPFAVLAIDVDNLKVINDNYGHEAGDEALRAVGQVLHRTLRDADLVARTGGDEFAAILPGAGAEEASDAAERMRHALAGAAFAHGMIRLSVGCAARAAGTSVRDAWVAADEALYHAKTSGRDRVVEASAAVLGESARPMPELEIVELLTSRAITAVYQPIVRLRDQSIFGAEALARPEGAAASHSVERLFVAAQRYGYERDLDWLCRRAALQGSAELPAGVAVFVNIGMTAFLDPLHDVDQMLMLLEWAGRDPSQVVLEITERDAIRDLERFQKVLAEYRRHGFRFALDDVGEGHSTFEVLAAAVPEFIKLAARFARVGDHPGPHSAIRAAVTFAKSTNAQVIAEGLEGEANVALMTELGVEFGQGFALHRPIRATEFPQQPISAPRRSRLEVVAAS